MTTSTVATIAVSEYLKRLKQYKAFVKHFYEYCEYSRSDRIKIYKSMNGKNNRNLYAFFSLVLMSHIPVMEPGWENPTYRRMDIIDEAILSSNIYLGMDDVTGHIKIYHELFGPSDNPYPLIPLNEYICYLERGIKDGSISPMDTYVITRYTSKLPIYTVCTINHDTAKYPTMALYEHLFYTGDPFDGEKHLTYDAFTDEFILGEIEKIEEFQDYIKKGGFDRDHPFFRLEKRHIHDTKQPIRLFDPGHGANNYRVLYHRECNSGIK